MPTNLVLHKGNALALRGLGDDGGRLALGDASLGKGGANLIEVVAVGKLHHVELKGAELVGKRHGVVDFLDGAVDLQAVVVDDHAEVIELLVAGEHGSLPDLALLALAIAQQGVRAISIAPVLGGNRHTHGGGDALAK